MPARPRWLLALPDAIAQLDALDRPLLTRRDLESLFGVSRARAATLMRAFGAELTGSIRTLPAPRCSASSGGSSRTPPFGEKKPVETGC